MKKENYIKLFSAAIKKVETTLAFNDIECISSEIYTEDDSLYFKFGYQIDDRLDRSSDKKIEEAIEKILGKQYGVSVKRMDAYPNGYAYYNTTIDK